MPSDDRILQLLDALKGDLHAEKLEWLSREFEALAQDRDKPLIFFVLENVCRRLADALEGEAVTVERFSDLTAGIAEQITSILQHVHEGMDAAALDALVGTLFRNLALYRD